MPPPGLSGSRRAPIHRIKLPRNSLIARVILAAPEQAPIITFCPTKNFKETLMLKGFRDFILRGNVMDLAVAVIIGAAFTAIVTALTTNIISPILGAFIGKPNFDYLVLHVNGGAIEYGKFLTAIVNFLILAAVVYFFLVIPTQ
jgi:large conductance mechanosensitive channel protein